MFQHLVIDVTRTDLGSQLVLNEQFMVSAHDPGPGKSPPILLTNKVIKTLSTHGNEYKTFGENIILLLNRESMLTSSLYYFRKMPSTWH